MLAHNQIQGGFIYIVKRRGPSNEPWGTLVGSDGMWMSLLAMTHYTQKPTVFFVFASEMLLFLFVCWVFKNQWCIIVLLQHLLP